MSCRCHTYLGENKCNCRIQVSFTQGDVENLVKYIRKNQDVYPLLATIISCYSAEGGVELDWNSSWSHLRHMTPQGSRQLRFDGLNSLRFKDSVRMWNTDEINQLQEAGGAFKYAFLEN